MRKLSQHLFRSVVPGILLILLTVGVLLDMLIAGRLEEEFDQLLVAKSQGLVALSEFEEEGFMVEQYERALPQFTNLNNGEYFQFQNDNGDVLTSSLSMPADQLIALPTTRPSRSYLDITLPDGRLGRVLRTRFLPRVDIEDVGGEDQILEMDTVILDKAGTPIPEALTHITSGGENFIREPLTLYLAISREPLDKLITQVHLLLLIAGFLTMAAIAWLARRQIEDTVAPLGSITNQISLLDHSQLEQRINISEPVAELDVMVQQFNKLLDRLEQAFLRERRFSGDVAHELRTPLAELRVLVDVNKRWPDDPELAKNFLTDVGQSTQRMQNTVESLLTLSRSEGIGRELEPTNKIAELLTDAVEFARQRAAAQNVTLLLSLDTTPVTVLGRDEWPVIVSNLLENAIDYSEAGTPVSIALQVDTEQKTLRVMVTNTVTDLQEADLPYLFERLWRKDKARSSSSHCGLGLSIVKAYTDRVGAKIGCELNGNKLNLVINAPLMNIEPVDTTPVNDTEQSRPFRFTTS